METNVFGAWRTTLALLPLLRRATHPRIVNVSSQSGSLASMGAGTPATRSRRRRSTRSHGRCRPSCAPTVCS
jgi:NAD(P)-dependent dehydrogenase (short-subunit alcohol dehydrogenase family)